MDLDMDGLHYLYEIRNRVNDKKYIGVTNDYKRRMYWHHKNLTDGEHSNSHLQRAFDLYGPTSFEYDLIGIAFSEIDICLDEMAAIWKVYPNCYNKLLGVPWTKYTPQTSIKDDKRTEPEPLLMARIKKAKKKKKQAKARKKIDKARKRRDRKEMLKKIKVDANNKLKKPKPIINKISSLDMHELRMESIILKAKKELNK